MAAFSRLEKREAAHHRCDEPHGERPLALHYFALLYCGSSVAGSPRLFEQFQVFPRLPSDLPHE